MTVYLNNIHGVDDAIVTMYMSKRSWTREKEEHIRALANTVLDKNGFPCVDDYNKAEWEEFNELINKVVKWGSRHMTMLRFIDLCFTVQGMHYAGTADIDSHSMRYNNRIIRSSTRLADFSYELSEYYNDKIIPTDVVLHDMNISVPDKIDVDGNVYIKTVNGYILESEKDNKDVKRGLYMLSIPQDFIFKVNLTEFAHVYKERNANGSANPEVKNWCEQCADQIESQFPQFNRTLLLKIPN